MPFRSKYLFKRSAEVKQVSSPLTSVHQASPVLLVGEDGDQLSLFIELLSNQGFEVVAREDEESIEELVHEIKPGLILSIKPLFELKGYVPLQQQTETGKLSTQVLIRESKIITSEESPFAFPEADSDIEPESKSSAPPIPDSSGLEEFPPKRSAALKNESGSFAEIEKYLAEFKDLEEGRFREPVPQSDRIIDELFEGSLADNEREDSDSVVSGEEPFNLPEDDYSSRMTAAAKTEADPAEILFQRLRKYVYESILLVKEGRIPDLSAGELLVSEMQVSLSNQVSLQVKAMDRDQEYQLTLHSSNVAILAGQICNNLQLTEKKTAQIMLAALLHEVGVTRLPEKIIYRSDTISVAEKCELRRRPLYGSEALQSVDPEFSWLPAWIGQVYERENGSGFPMGLPGNRIYYEAKILGISDLFDACIHFRPYRDALTGYQTLFELTTRQSGSFPDHLIKALIKSVSLYPYNEWVLLNTGQIGRVVGVNYSNLSKPVVQVVFVDGKRPEAPETVDLLKEKDCFITRAVTLRELPEG